MKSNTDRVTASSTSAAMMTMRIFSGRVIKLPELPIASGEVGVNVEVGAKVVGDVGFGIEVEVEPSGMVIVCVLLQQLSS